MGWIKKKCWVLLIAVVAIMAPFVLNWVILQPQKFEVVGDGTHWLGFWATYISAVASFAMVFITWKTLEQMKQQWDESKRPRLNFSIVANQLWYNLKISNIGQENAYNIKLNFNAEFIDNLPCSGKEYFERFQNSPFFIETGCSKYLFICACSEAVSHWKDKCEYIEIQGSYCEKYTINESLNIAECTIGGVICNDELTNTMGYIKEGLIARKNEHYPIQESLDIIAKKIDNVLPKEETE